MDNIVFTPIPIEQLTQIINESVAAAIANVPKPEPQCDPNKRLTIKQVCEKYSVSKPTIHKHMHKGLEFEKLGRKTLFRTAVVEAYFRSQTR